MAQLLTGLSSQGIRESLNPTCRDFMDHYHETRFNDPDYAKNYTDRFRSRVMERRKEVLKDRAYTDTTMMARRLKAIGRENIIRQHWDVGSLQNAAPVMQKYIASNPVVRKRWHNKTIACYEDSNLSNSPWRKGYRNTDPVYRQVMDGVIHKDDNNVTKATCYHHPDGTKKLSAAERGDILHTWNAVTSSIWDGVEDPTSQYNARI